MNSPIFAKSSSARLNESSNHLQLHLPDPLTIGQRCIPHYLPISPLSSTINSSSDKPFGKEAEGSTNQSSCTIPCPYKHTKQQNKCLLCHKGMRWLAFISIDSVCPPSPPGLWKPSPSALSVAPPSFLHQTSGSHGWSTNAEAVGVHGALVAGDGVPGGHTHT